MSLSYGGNGSSRDFTGMKHQEANGCFPHPQPDLFTHRVSAMRLPPDDQNKQAHGDGQDYQQDQQVNDGWFAHE